MNESKAVRLSRMADEIGYALGRGELPELMLREFRFLWLTTPDQEKEGLRITLKDIEDFVKTVRNEQDSQATGMRGKVQRVGINYKRPYTDVTA